MNEWVKIGRLLPGEEEIVIINHDQLGDIGVLTVLQIQELLKGNEPQEIKAGPFNDLKVGDADLSILTTGCKMVIPTNTGSLFVAITRQVLNMLDNWPNKKAALWTPKI